jgi:L-threonylcarbamoyladenylate synthase
MIFDSSQIQQAADLIKRGELVAFPTETVYGLGASVFQEEAIQKIFQVKGRPSDNPLIVHISHLDQLKQIVGKPAPLFYRLADRFFPGPLTILLPKLECVPSIVSANLPTIGVRMPAHPLAQALIHCVGVPLVAPSANLSGRPSSTTAQHVIDDFGNAIAGVLDGGPCSLGIESTVITLTPQPTILRPGAITQSDLENLLQQPFVYAHEHVKHPLSPGMKYRHYAPKAKVILFEKESAYESYLNKGPSKKRAMIKTIRQEELYALLRQADREGCEEILIYCNPSVCENRALMNRLKRASQ